NVRTEGLEHGPSVLLALCRADWQQAGALTASDERSFPKPWGILPGDRDEIAVHAGIIPHAGVSVGAYSWTRDRSGLNPGRTSPHASPRSLNGIDSGRS